MQTNHIILLGIAILVCALVWARHRTAATSSQPFQWQQVLVGVIAVIAAALIVATPEFAALGLLGDATFFDLLVLLIGLQLRMVAVQACCWFRALPLRILRWLMAPRLSYLLLLASIAAIGSAASAVGRLAHRLCSSSELRMACW